MNGKILIVDDETSVRRTLRRVLEPLGLVVHEASDGDIAIDLIRRLRPNLILLDLHLPVLDGLSVLSEIKDVAPEASVIVLTGDPEPRRAKSALELGAVDFLSKPIDMGLLERAVLTHMPHAPEPASAGRFF